MSGRVQSRIAAALAATLVLLGAHCASLSAKEATIVPLIDREGACVYCDVVAGALAAARSSIDLLLSNAEVEGNPLWEHVIEAHERGVSVRVLLDSSDWAPSITAKNRPTVTHLAGHGIEVRFDDPEMTTHAKLVIVDRRTAILGSTNWNRYAFDEHEQANVLVECETVGAAFAEYFDRLWEDRLPPEGVALDPEAAKATLPTIIPLFDTDGTATYASLVLALLQRAQRSVHVALYRMSVYPGYQSSSSNELVDALISAAGRGLDVRVLLDDCSYYADSAEANLMAAIYLYQRGVEVRLDEPEKTTHAKLIVIDGVSVVLGSTNWNYYSLERNVEVNLAMLNIAEAGAAYEAYFEQLWSDGRQVGP